MGHGADVDGVVVVVVACGSTQAGSSRATSSVVGGGAVVVVVLPDAGGAGSATTSTGMRSARPRRAGLDAPELEPGPPGAGQHHTLVERAAPSSKVVEVVSSVESVGPSAVGLAAVVADHPPAQPGELHEGVGERGAADDAVR